MSDFKHVQEQIAEDALNVRSELGLQGGSVDSFHRLLDTMQALLDVAVHAKRHRADPSWNRHATNLDDAIDKLQEQNDG